MYAEGERTEWRVVTKTIGPRAFKFVVLGEGVHALCGDRAGCEAVAATL